MSEVAPYRQGQLVGRYRIVRLIGEGGMGAVYEAVHVVLKKRVAVKVLLPRVAENQDARGRFLREGEAASRINHPHVVSVLDVGEDGGTPYLVMEYLEGRTLGDLLAERGRLDLTEATELFLPVLAAVAAGHDSGVVHRDLKPQNIFLARGRWGELVPKVLDFGVSKLIDHEGAPVTRTQAVLGTACYMSPEQARGARNVEARSDQFALGLILYEMLTGQRAYQGANDLEILYAASAGVVRPAEQVRSGLPAELYVVLARMLAISPSDRFPHLRDGGRLLLPFAGDQTRTTLGGDFTGPVSVPPAVEPVQGPAPAALAGNTALLLPRTQELREDTTLRHAAVERPREPAKRALRPAFKIAIAIAVPAAAGAALIVWTATRRPEARVPAAVAVAPVVVAAPEPAPPASPPPVPPAAERTTSFEVRAFPPEAELALDGRKPLRGRLEMVLPLAGDAHEIRVSAPGYASKVVSFRADESPPEEIRLEPVVAPVKPAKPKTTNKTKTKTTTNRAPKPDQPKRGSNDALIIR